MKLIGVEIRVGARGIGQEIKREVKLVPLEIIWPDILSSYHAQPTVEVTFHTSLGDMTLQGQLPMGSFDNSRQVSHDEIRKAMQKFADSLEA